MRTIPKWMDRIQDGEKNGQSIYDLCFKPDGTQLIVAGGHHVLVYDTAEGTLIQLLKGHKDKVHSVSYARNGQKFASGSADKTVILWSSKLEGLLKYSHNDSVQCLAFNPLSHQLASCALSDFAFWSSDQKAVQKHKVSARINSCSWTRDGQYLALALNNGVVSIRNKLGEEKGRVERPGAVWAMAWSPEDQLCVTDWNRTLTFYTLGGKLVGKERNLNFNPLKISYFPKGDFILISGTNCCKLYTKEGIKLGMIGEEQQKSWVWCCQADPGGNFVALGCEDGTLAFYQVVFNTIHGLYQERYAYRENMTDVIIQHLITEQKVRIKCRDLIKKIAIYTDRLAVQLPERVVIYELYSKDSHDMHYRAKEKIAQKLDCSLLVIASNHLVICHENTLRSIFFSGDKDKEWHFPSSISYIKNCGGPGGKEGLLLGLKNGEVWEVHLDNIHPLKKLQVAEGVRCLDVSPTKTKLAVVDDLGLLQVFENAQLQYQESNVASCSFNQMYEEMLGYSGGGELRVKVQDFQPHVQKLGGFLVGLSGAKAFCLTNSKITVLELPLSAPMYQFVEHQLFEEAYKIACLGVTQGDWEDLGHSALERLEFEVARLSFIKLQDFTYLELIEELRSLSKKEVILGDVLAMKGKFKEAARMYQKAGEAGKALTMYTDLRMFDEAQEFLNPENNNDLIKQKADWAKNIQEYKAAAEMYISIQNYQEAIKIYGEQKWSDLLIDLARKLDNPTALQMIASQLKQLHCNNLAGEVYNKLGDREAMLQLHIEAQEWGQAFSLVQHQPELQATVLVPYAHWLAERDQYLQAQKAFHKAGQSHHSLKLFTQLTDNAISEQRFQDASYYFWITSRQSSKNNNEHLADIYYAYDTVHKYLEEPFTSYMPEALFNLSRFLMVEMCEKKPAGVSAFAIYFTLAKQARKLGANKLAKQMLDKIGLLRVPKKFEEQLEIAAVAARARPYRDPEELLPMCYRCSTYNPLIASRNACVNCGQPFVFSFFGFELLPLVEFTLEEEVADEEALRLIESPPHIPEEAQEEGRQRLEVCEDDADDPFVFKGEGGGRFEPIRLNRKQLQDLDGASVLVSKWPSPFRWRFYKNILPEVRVSMCATCFKPFHVDDFELLLLQKGFCPFCRTPPEGATVSAEEILV